MSQSDEAKAKQSAAFTEAYISLVKCLSKTESTSQPQIDHGVKPAIREPPKRCQYRDALDKLVREGQRALAAGCLCDNHDVHGTK